MSLIGLHTGNCELPPHPLDFVSPEAVGSYPTPMRTPTAFGGSVTLVGTSFPQITSRKAPKEKATKKTGLAKVKHILPYRPPLPIHIRPPIWAAVISVHLNPAFNPSEFMIYRPVRKYAKPFHILSPFKEVYTTETTSSGGIFSEDMVQSMLLGQRLIDYQSDSPLAGTSSIRAESLLSLMGLSTVPRTLVLVVLTPTLNSGGKNEVGDRSAKDQSTSDISVRALINTWTTQSPVVLLADASYKYLPYDVSASGATYVVLGAYVIKDAWRKRVSLWWL